MQVNESKESGNFYDLHKEDGYLMGMEEKQSSALPGSLCLITSWLPVITGPKSRFSDTLLIGSALVLELDIGKLVTLRFGVGQSPQRYPSLVAN